MVFTRCRACPEAEPWISCTLTENRAIRSTGQMRKRLGQKVTGNHLVIKLSVQKKCGVPVTGFGYGQDTVLYVVQFSQHKNAACPIKADGFSFSRFISNSSTAHGPMILRSVLCLRSLYGATSRLLWMLCVSPPSSKRLPGVTLGAKCANECI